MTQQKLQAEIAKLDAKLAQGISSTTTDGTSVSVDLKVVQAERDRLQALLVFQQRRRPRSGTMRIW